MAWEITFLNKKTRTVAWADGKVTKPDTDIVQKTLDYLTCQLKDPTGDVDEKGNIIPLLGPVFTFYFPTTEGLVGEELTAARAVQQQAAIDRGKLELQRWNANREAPFQPVQVGV